MNVEVLPALKTLVNNADTLLKEKGQIETDIRALADSYGVRVRADGKIAVIKEGGQQIELGGSYLVKVPFEKFRDELIQLFTKRLDENDAAFDNLNIPEDR